MKCKQQSGSSSYKVLLTGAARLGQRLYIGTRSIMMARYPTGLNRLKLLL
ncbi:MAG: hypothetical protein IPL01_05485 [Acidobacteria bacterium]|nr:hypothetical protein [Acidobacteriota bacterium]